MAKLTLTDLTALEPESSAVTSINANNALIETALENTLSRDGTSPNTMSAQLDMNSKRIVNLPAPGSSSDPIRVQDITDYVADVTSGGVDSVNSQTGAVVLDPDDLDDSATTNKFATAAQLAVVDALVSATTSTEGTVELATTGEISTGTDTTRAVTPRGLAGSIFGKEIVQIEVFGPTSTCTTGDGKRYFHVPSPMNGMNLVEVHAECITAGTTGTMDIQIHNVTQASDMLSTVLSIDSTETGSDTAATSAVIDTANDDIATNDLVRIDIDAVHTTAAIGLLVTMVFQLP